MRNTPLLGVTAVLAAVLLLTPVSMAQVGTGFDYDESTGEAMGTYVSFTFDEATGTVTDYTLSAGPQGDASVTVFASIEIENWSAETQMGQPPVETQFVSAGAVWAAIGAKATVRAIDNPVGNLAIANVGLLSAPGFQGDIGQIGDMDFAQQWLDAGNTVTFTLDPALTATFEGAQPEVGGGFVNITGDDFRGFIMVSAGAVSVDQNVVTVTLEGPEAAFFHGLPLFGDAEDQEFEEDVADAAARGDVGARASVTVSDGDVGVVVSPFRTSFQISVRAATPGERVELDLSSTQPEGTIVVVDLPADAVDVNREIQVTLDGEAVQEVASLDLVVDAKSQGAAEPVVHLKLSEDGLTLSLWVPGFSTKTLTVESVSTAAEGDGTIAGVPILYVVAGIAVLIILVGVAAAVKRRK